ncbi:MAG: B12-binding domain-containing protein [Actinomycetia bacterium]|nr:B12-binding domain-containing protein [Actinomycetes bacterium]
MPDSVDGPAVVDKPISLHEAASRLGVHYMTVYRYVRTGRLPGTQVNGEWQIDPADLAELANAKKNQRRGRARKSSGEWADRFQAQLLAGDEAGAWKVAEDVLTSGMKPTQFYLEVLVPTLRHVGEAWSAGELSIAQEHQASAIARRVVGRLGPQFAKRGRKRGTVILGAPAGEQHDLPIAILADLVREAGFRVSDLGANLPAESFVEFVRDAADVVAIGVSVTAAGNEENVVALTAQLRSATEAPIVLGGHGIPDEATALELGADYFADSGPAAVRRFDDLAAVRNQDKEA